MKNLFLILLIAFFFACNSEENNNIEKPVQQSNVVESEFEEDVVLQEDEPVTVVMYSDSSLVENKEDISRNDSILSEEYKDDLVFKSKHPELQLLIDYLKSVDNSYLKLVENSDCFTAEYCVGDSVYNLFINATSVITDVTVGQSSDCDVRESGLDTLGGEDFPVWASL